MSVEWSWQRAADSLPILIDGFKITLLATVLGMAIASVLGLVIAIARRTCPAYVRVPLRWITEFIRLTPLVVQLLFVYYLLPQFSALQIGIAVLGVHYSTYMAEVYRAGSKRFPPDNGRLREPCLFRRRERGELWFFRRLYAPPYRRWETTRFPCSRTHRSSSQSRWSNWSPLHSNTELAPFNIWSRSRRQE